MQKITNQGVYMRFIWVDNKELYDSTLGMCKRNDGSEYSNYDVLDEGFVYDNKDKCVVMDFGNDQQYYPACGTKPNEKYLKIILGALNEQVNKKD